jgi:mRNA turnover protein 4
VALTATAKKTREHKSELISEIRDAIDAHSSLYLFSFENMRSNKFKDVRMHFRDADMEGNMSRIFLGKNKLMQVALGRGPEDEHSENLSRVSKLTTGSVGLLVTSRGREDVEGYFSTLVEKDFARAGAVAPSTLKITGDMVATHPISMTEQFRKLGMPVEVQNGKIGLVGGKTEFVACKEGQPLSAEACKILVHFGVKAADFRVKLICRWSDGEFEAMQ